MIKLFHGNCLDVMKTLEAESVHAVVTDPPYHLTSKPGGKAGFMGKTWDGGGVAFDPATWQEALRVLKPGGHLLALGGSRTYHRLTCAIEDAGFEIRDSLQFLYDADPLVQAFLDSLSEMQRELLAQAWPSEGLLAWVYGQGFPKSLDVSKMIDREAGAVREIGPIDPARAGRLVNQRGEYTTEAGWSAGNRTITQDPPATDLAKQWQGFGSALKPAHEPCVLARKPLIGTLVKNVVTHGTGAMNIDGCRVLSPGNDHFRPEIKGREGGFVIGADGRTVTGMGKFAPGASFMPTNHEGGRWPANLVHDGSDAVLAEFPQTTSGKAEVGTGSGPSQDQNAYSGPAGGIVKSCFADSGSAARFFYTAKVSKKERNGTKHPTAKPLALMEWLVKLVTPPGGVVLDPFMGSGTTLVAAQKLGFDGIGVELEEQYYLDAHKRLGKHCWRSDPQDPAGWRCALCGVGDQDERAAGSCGGKE